MKHTAKKPKRDYQPKCRNCGHTLNLWHGEPSHRIRHIKNGIDFGCGYPCIDKGENGFCDCMKPEIKPIELVA